MLGIPTHLSVLCTHFLTFVDPFFNFVKLKKVLQILKKELTLIELLISFIILYGFFNNLILSTLTFKTIILRGKSFKRNL
jgi:hypothetical protein